MRLKAQTIETITEGFDATEMGMETNDPAVIQIVLENIYSDPYVWPRELLANWMDAGGGGELILPDVLDPNWSIEDTGPGMSHEFMRTTYAKIFASTKRNSDSKIGGFGHGRLSPLAYTDTYTVRSRFVDDNGIIMEGNYLIFKGENKIPKVTPLSLVPSEVQQTGVKVVIPVGDKDIKRITDRTRFFASYLDEQPKGFDPVKHLFKNEIGGVRAKGQDSDMPGIRLIVGGVPYPMPRSAGMSNNIPFDLFFGVDEMSPTLARDAINGDAATVEKIKLNYKKLIQSYRAGAIELINKETSVLDRYVKYAELSGVLDWSTKNVIFDNTFTVPYALETKLLFAAVKGDFNVHDIYSDIDKTAWKDLDDNTKNLRSLNQIRIKDLAGHGVAARKEGHDLSEATEISFRGFVDRQGRGDVDPQIALFGIKLPYQQGQIKLIKEAMAAKLTELRTAPTNPLRKEVKVLLIQYENEADAITIGKLIAPKLPVHIITDTSTRISAQKYVSVIMATPQSYSRTKAVRISSLKNDSTLKVFIREPDQKAYTVNAMFDTLRRMDIFSKSTLIAVMKSELDLLPPNYVLVEDFLLNHIKKNFGYTLDYKAVQAHLQKAQQANKPLNAGILKYGVQSQKSINPRPKFYELLKANENLKDDEVLKAAIALVEKEDPKKDDLQDLYQISNFVRDIEVLRGLKFFKKPIPEGTRPLPAYTGKDKKALDAFSDKYPLIEAIRAGNDYSLRDYGITKVVYDGIVDYMESKQPRNCN